MSFEDLLKVAIADGNARKQQIADRIAAIDDDIAYPEFIIILENSILEAAKKGKSYINYKVCDPYWVSLINGEKNYINGYDITQFTLFARAFSLYFTNKKLGYDFYIKHSYSLPRWGYIKISWAHWTIYQENNVELLTKMDII